MSNWVPMYEGDSIIHERETVVESAPVKAADEPVLLQRTRDFDAEVDVPDLVTIESRAREMRAEVVWSIVAAIGERIERWLERRRQREHEAYLAQSQTLAELEDRLHRLERGGHVLHI